VRDLLGSGLGIAPGEAGAGASFPSASCSRHAVLSCSMSQAHDDRLGVAPKRLTVEDCASRDATGMSPSLARLPGSSDEKMEPKSTRCSCSSSHLHDARRGVDARMVAPGAAALSCARCVDAFSPLPSNGGPVASITVTFGCLGTTCAVWSTSRTTRWPFESRWTLGGGGAVGGAVGGGGTSMSSAPFEFSRVMAEEGVGGVLSPSSGSS